MVIPYRRVHKKTLLSRLIKWAVIFAIFLAIVLSVLIFLFNGNKVKEPLTDFINNKLGTEFTVNSVEFSPLYPNTIKLIKPAFNDTLSADEIYLEIDLKTAFADKILAIRDLYIKNLRLNHDAPEFLRQKLSTLKFDDIKIAALRIDGTPVYGYGIKSDSARIRLYNITLNKDLTYSVKEGNLSFNKGSFLNLPFKNLSFAFTHEGDNLNLKDLHAAVLGGSIAGEGSYNLQKQTFTFNRLNLNKIIIKDGLSPFSSVSISGKEVSLNDCLFTNQEILLSGITGSASSFSLLHGNITADFKGSLDEISLIKHRLSLTDSTVSARVGSTETAGNIIGSLFDGDISFNFNYQNKDKTLSVNNFNLKNNKIEYTSNLETALNEFINPRQIYIESCNFSNLAFISHVSDFPLNILDFSGNIDNLAIIKGKVQNRKAGIINLDANSLTYSDFLLNKIKLIATISPELLSLSAPEIKFRSSDVSLSGSLALKEGPSFLLLQGKNFNLADLNSNLSRRLLSGRADIEVNLQSFGSFDKLIENTDGTFYLKSPEMLVSNLALDYLNGGDAKTRNFAVKDLSAALYDKDCGLYDLNLLGSVKRGNIYVSGNFNLSSDNVTANLHIDLRTMLISALCIIENKLEGNTTQISVSNKLNDPKITIKPIQRGTIRPGLSDIDKTEESQKTQALEHASQS